MRITVRNKDGFSIVMVLVSAALLGLLALGFSEMIGGAMKGQKNVQNAVDFDILKTSMNMVLNTKACDGAFKNAAGNSVELSFPGSMLLGTNIIAAASPVPIAKVLQGNSLIAEQGGNLGGGMTISKLELVDAIYDGDQTVGGVPYKAFVATLNVEATKAAGSYGKQSPQQKFSVRLLILPNAANTLGTVQRCDNYSGSSWEDISSDTLPFDYNCDYKMLIPNYPTGSGPRRVTVIATYNNGNVIQSDFSSGNTASIFRATKNRAVVDGGVTTPAITFRRCR